MRRLFEKFMLVLVALTSVSLVCTAFAQEPQRDDPQPPKVIRKSGGVLQGSATKRVEPVYPPLAKAARISGSVVVEVVLDEEGNVTAARAISGHPLLKDSAVAAAKGWTFNPTQLQGVPVKVIGTITFNFNLGSRKNLEALEADVRSNPNSAQAHLELANAYAERERNDEAIGEYKEAIRLNPDHALAYYQLGSLFERLDRVDEALDAYRRLTTVKHELDSSGQPEFKYADLAYLNMASIYAKKGQYREALEVLNQLVSLHPELDAAHYSLAQIHLKLGDKQSALNEYNILKQKNAEAAEQLLRQIEKQP